MKSVQKKPKTPDEKLENAWNTLQEKDTADQYSGIPEVQCSVWNRIGPLIYK